MKQWWSVFIVILSIMLVLSSCAQPPAEAPPEVTPPAETTPPTPTPTPSPPTPTPLPDTTPPSAITGLVATDAYDGRVNLWWDKSTAEDFDHYDIYVSQAEIVDASGITPTHQIGDMAANTYQVTGLEEGAKCYFAVTAVDKSGNEDTLVTCVSATPTPMPRGTVDPEISVDIYQSDKAWPGTTLMRDCHNRERPRIIEVNMLGEIVWEYLVPENLGRPGDVELLPNNNILFEVTDSGVYEINRNGDIVWSYLDKKVSHDADRLHNGNTLVVWGMGDEVSDAQVKEINPEGKIVWAWYAKDHFYESPYKDIYDQGWTHTNAVTRLQNGNTLISPRNFNLVVEVDPQGSVVKTLGEGIVFDAQGEVVKILGEGILFGPHDPEVLPNGNILAISQNRPHRAVEIDSKTGKIVWQFVMPEPVTWPARDANRLPNGNTLITGSTKIVEVTPEGGIAWQLTLKGVTFERGEAAGLGFYKADRIGVQR